MPYFFNKILISFSLPKKPVNSSHDSLIAVSKNDSELSVTPPKSEKPCAESSNSFSLPNKKLLLKVNISSEIRR